jgi:hypothetical protein
VKWYFAEEELLLAYDFPCNHGAGSGRMHIGSSLCLHWLHTQRNAMPRKQRRYNTEWTRTLRGGRGAAVCKVARSTHRLLRGTRLVPQCALPRQERPVARPPTHPFVPTRHESR